MGPLLGIILVDYYLIAKGEVNVEALYREDGEYRYQGGWNVNALIATAIGACSPASCPTSPACCPHGGAFMAGSSAWRSGASSTTRWR
jgi:NCS1 family nucleobase:cation symporter-1